MRRASIAAGAIWAGAIWIGAIWAAGWTAASAAPLDDLKAQGFVVVKETRIEGDFDGCDYGREVPLAGGGVFTCSNFAYMHASRPKAVLLKSKDGRQYKLVVNNAVFEGGFS